MKILMLIFFCSSLIKILNLEASEESILEKHIFKGPIAVAILQNLDLPSIRRFQMTSHTINEKSHMIIKSSPHLNIPFFNDPETAKHIDSLRLCFTSFEKKQDDESNLERSLQNIEQKTEKDGAFKLFMDKLIYLMCEEINHWEIFSLNLMQKNVLNCLFRGLKPENQSWDEYYTKVAHPSLQPSYIYNDIGFSNICTLTYYSIFLNFLLDKVVSHSKTQILDDILDGTCETMSIKLLLKNGCEVHNDPEKKSILYGIIARFLCKYDFSTCLNNPEYHFENKKPQILILLEKGAVLKEEERKMAEKIFDKIPSLKKLFVEFEKK